MKVDWRRDIEILVRPNVVEELNDLETNQRATSNGGDLGWGRRLLLTADTS